jgi:NADPH:quinone reductase-like Zn-dependent oxidoreductase
MTLASDRDPGSAERTPATATMRAVVHDTYGSAEVLEVRQVPRPEPGDGEVLVRVRAAGLDRGVWHLVAGRPYLVRLATGLRRPRRRVIGMDVAGVVEAVGAGVRRFRVGEEVFGIGRGSFADVVAVPEAKLAPKPAGSTFEEAAVVPISAGTALHALRDRGDVQPGQRVLVLGASGGVGTYTVQLAVAFGAEVTAVCSAGKADLVRSLGAERVLDYATEDPTDGSVRYDLIIDIAGNRGLRALRRALTPTGTLVIVGGEGGGRWTGGLDRQLRAVAWSPFVKQRMKMFVAPERAEDLEFLTPLLESGRVRPVIDAAVPLDRVPEAFRRLEEGRVRGKLAVVVSGSE